MAKDKTKKRLRKALRKQDKRQQQEARRHPLGPGRGGPIFQQSPPLWDEPGWDDPEGGAGVREPRRPYPSTPAAALALDEPQPLYLDLAR